MSLIESIILVIVVLVGGIIVAFLGAVVVGLLLTAGVFLARQISKKLPELWDRIP